MSAFVLLALLLLQRTLSFSCFACKTDQSGLVASSEPNAINSSKRASEKAERVWVKHYLSLLLFRQRMGHCDTAAHSLDAVLDVECSSLQSRKTLSRWLRKQRCGRKANSLCETKIARLSSAGIQWDVPNSGFHEVLSKLPKSRRRLEGWAECYRALLFFRQTHGHCDVATMGYGCEDKRFGRWVRWQRELYKRGEIKLQRKVLLQGVGFSWKIRSSELAHRGWNARFADLVAYKAQFGDCAVPENGSTAKVQTLGRWVTQQRTKHKLGLLPAVRAAELSQLGFIWDHHGAEWEAIFRQLILYRQRHGHCAVSVARAGESGRRFGLWVNNQRSMARDGRGIDSRRRLRLDSVGFCWNVKEAAWHRQFERLRKFIEESGSCDPPPTASTRYLCLWLRKQVALQHCGQLCRSREVCLLEAGVILGRPPRNSSRDQENGTPSCIGVCKGSCESLRANCYLCCHLPLPPPAQRRKRTP